VVADQGLDPIRLDVFMAAHVAVGECLDRNFGDDSDLSMLGRRQFIRVDGGFRVMGKCTFREKAGKGGGRLAARVDPGAVVTGLTGYVEI
jgi:hypothetical protein